MYRYIQSYQIYYTLSIFQLLKYWMQTQKYKTVFIVLCFISISLSQYPFQVSTQTGSSFTNVLQDITTPQSTQNQPVFFPTNYQQGIEDLQVKGVLQSELRTCKNQDAQQCKLTPLKIGRQADQKMVNTLKKIWESYEIDSFEKVQNNVRVLNQQIISELQLSQEQKKQFFGNSQQPKSSKPNLRKLFSANNQYQSINEGSIMAYDEQYLYIVQNDQFLVIETKGTNLKQLYRQTLKGSSGRAVLVYKKYIAVITQKYQPSSVEIWIYQNFNGRIVKVKRFQREGFYADSREYNGNISLIIQDYTITDLSWDVNQRSIFAFVDACATWVSGNFIRNYITIDFNAQLDFKIVTYVGCDYIRTVNVSPTGNWYVVSADFTLGNTNSIIQRVDINKLETSDWVALGNAIIDFPNRLDEGSDCRLRVAAIGKFGVIFRLRLYYIDCSLEIRSKGIFGPVRTILTTRWIQNSVYVSFYTFNNGLIYQFTEDSQSFSLSGTVSHVQNIYSLYRFGQSHMIGLGKKSKTLPNKNEYSILLYNVEQFKKVYEYNINPGTNYMYAPIYQPSYQFIHLDFKNNKIILPISSNASQPYSKGYYFLYIDTNSPCIISPPINRCSGFPTSLTQSLSKVYKHWDAANGYIWANGDSQQIYRTVTINKYFYTMSNCQIQARQEPSTTNPTFGVQQLRAPYILDLCK